MALTIDEVKSALHVFLEGHPFSFLKEEIDPTGAKTITVQLPWDDESIQLTIPDDATSLVSALNSVLLPPRLTALWHRDSNDLEIIWTALPLPPSTKGIEDRSFIFCFNGISYQCEFGVSSDRLLIIASQSETLHFSETNGRNLGFFETYANHKDDPGFARVFEGAKPLSFWIKKIDEVNDLVIQLIEHLNFYMSYFDKETPRIIIHPPTRKKVSAKPQIRYRKGVFPKYILTKEIDNVLLNYWTAAASGDPSRKFLYYYRILEYAASIYIDHSTKISVRKLLTAPDIRENVHNIEEKLISTIQRYKDKAEDFIRMESLLRDTVDPCMLWREVERNIDIFSKDIEFDGGFKLKALVAAGGREEDYTVQALTTFHKYVRDIRNALSHGKDQRSEYHILATTHNLENLQPWVSLISVAAGEVILFRDAV